MLRGSRNAAILFSILIGACNALNGVGDLGICSGDRACTAIAGEGGLLESGSPPDGSPTADAASGDAGQDAGFFGTGRSGPLALDGGPPMIVNLYAALTGAARAGDTGLIVGDSTGFAAGDLVLVWQATGLANVVSGSQTPVALAPTSVGHFEMARLANVSAMQLALSAPLAGSYQVAGSQVVQLPEYTDVTIPVASQITGRAWDGVRGGIVAFLATGTVSVLGEITADGLGFRGGVGQQGVSGTGCMMLDGEPAVGYAAKGEGIALDGYTTTTDGGGVGGRGNLANGAGGGVCHNGGGAGGGHGGSGGAGGLGMNGNGLGGLGGAPLLYVPLHGLLMGGGGAAGDDNNGVPLPSGGAGGGVVFVRARSMSGSGTIAARGATGLQAPGNDGSGGGGAGGGIVIVAETSLNGVVLRAEGGPGGSLTGAGGGGGSGGVVGVSTRSFQSSTVVTGGLGGGAPATLFMAAPGAAGRVNLLDGG